MNKLFGLLLWIFVLALMQPAEAQQTKTAASKTEAKKQAKPHSSKSGVTPTKDLPPEIERLEDTKIDPAPVSPAFDSSAAPNDELTTAIRQMFAASNQVSIGLSLAQKAIAQQQAANTDEKLDEFFNRFAAQLKTERVHRLFENIFIKIYRKHYTLEEVKQLTEFYRTPVGKKTLEVMPVTLQESQTEGSKLGEFLAREIFQQMEETKNQ